MSTSERSLVSKLREYGPGYFVQHAFARLTSSRHFDLHWFAVYQQLAPELDVPAEDLPGRRWATADDVDSSGSLGYAPEVCGRLFEQGARACVVERDGRIVAFSWFETGSVEQEGIRFQLDPNERWATLAGVVPEHRGQRIYSNMLVHAAHELASQGTGRFLGAIESLDRNPTHAASKIRGARVLGTVLYLRLGRLRLIRDKAGVLIPADGGKRGRHWITRRGQLQAKVGTGH